MGLCNAASDAPFVYKWPNGSIIPFGRLDVTSGVCVFDDADCSSHHVAGAPPCCTLSKFAKDGLATASTLSNFGPLGLLVLCIYVPSIASLVAKKRRNARLVAAGLPAGQEATMARPSSSIGQRFLVGMAYMLSIVLAILSPIVMQQSIQSQLEPANRVGVLFAMAFLVPFEEVFVFLEDTMTVRINFAMGRGDKVAVKGLFNAGIYLGMLAGLGAAVVASCLASSSTVLSALVYPVNPKGASAACALIGSVIKLADQLRPFFLLMAWAWPFSFVNRTLSGVFLGSGCLGAYSVLGAIRSATPLLVWFAGLGAGVKDKVTLLGFAYWCAAPIATLGMAAYLAASRGVRDQYGLHLNLHFWKTCFRRTANDPSAVDPEPPVLTREFVYSSLQAMATDLCTQLSVTAGVYAAASTGLSTAYQVAAMQSTLPGYGFGWILGVSLAAKSLGPQFIAVGKHRLFAAMCSIVVLYSLLVGLLVGLGGALPASRFLGFHAGTTACPYASDLSCAPLYAEIFDGDRSLSASFVSFGVVVVVNCPFLILKALLQACMDFKAQARIAAISLVVALVPALVAAELGGGGSAEALYLAMYAPHALMAVAFGSRLILNCRAMLRGDAGPWTEVKSFDAISSKLSTKLLPPGDGTDEMPHRTSLSPPGAGTSGGMPEYSTELTEGSAPSSAESSKGSA